MRPGQNTYKHNNNNNNNRNRSRSRRPGGGSGSSGNSGGNPINRVYESNGPDVKVRGTAQTVAEKYLQLGRDAQLAGDTVMAESYYQHAEHYFRIVSAAQAYQQQTQQQYRPNDDEEGGDDSDGMDNDDGGDASMERPQFASQGGQPQAEDQPDIMGFEPARPAGFPPAQTNGNNNVSQQREFRPRNNNNNEGGGNRSRNRFDRNRDRDGNPSAGDRQEPKPRAAGAEAAPEAELPMLPVAVTAPVAVEAPAEPNGIGSTWSEDSAPSFLRRPRGRPRREKVEESAAPDAAATDTPENA